MGTKVLDFWCGNAKGGEIFKEGGKLGWNHGTDIDTKKLHVCQNISLRDHSDSIKLIKK